MPSYNVTIPVDPDPTTNSSLVPVNETVTAPANASSSAIPFEVDDSPLNYCFLESQNWVGVDVDLPDCTLDPNNTLCSDPDAANRIVSSLHLTVLVRSQMTCSRQTCTMTQL